MLIKLGILVFSLPSKLKAIIFKDIMLSFLCVGDAAYKEALHLPLSTTMNVESDLWSLLQWQKSYSWKNTEKMTY